MSKQFSDLISSIKIIRKEVQTTFGKLSNEQLNWKPNEKEWSIGKCLEHLIVTNNLYFENIQKVADGTHQNNFYSKVPIVPNVIGIIMKKVLAPEWKLKMKTFKMFKPSFSEVSDSILEGFDENQNRFIGLMEATKDLDVHRIKVAEPIGSAVNISLNDAFEILVVHEKRHFNQAKRVMESKEFKG